MKERLREFHRKIGQSMVDTLNKRSTEKVPPANS